MTSILDLGFVVGAQAIGSRKDTDLTHKLVEAPRGTMSAFEAGWCEVSDR